MTISRSCEIKKSKGNFITMSKCQINKAECLKVQLPKERRMKPILKGQLDFIHLRLNKATLTGCVSVVKQRAYNNNK